MKCFVKLVQSNDQKALDISVSAVIITSEKSTTFKSGNSFSKKIADLNGMVIGGEYLVDITENPETYFSEMQSKIVTEERCQMSLITTNTVLVNRWVNEMPLTNEVKFKDYGSNKAAKQLKVAEAAQRNVVSIFDRVAKSIAAMVTAGKTTEEIEVEIGKQVTRKSITSVEAEKLLATI